MGLWNSSPLLTLNADTQLLGKSELGRLGQDTQISFVYIHKAIRIPLKVSYVDFNIVESL